MMRRSCKISSRESTRTTLSSISSICARIPRVHHRVAKLDGKLRASVENQLKDPVNVDLKDATTEMGLAHQFGIWASNLA
jgi:hypothetical protein